MQLVAQGAQQTCNKILINIMRKVRCPCNCFGYKAPALAVDAIVLKDQKILLIRRAKEPFKDCYALPGGFVECGESCEDAIKREVFEETGIEIEIIDLLGVYSHPNRDPRGHVVSICYIAKYKSGTLKISEETSDLGFFDLKDILKMNLAFDHKEIIKDFVKKCYNKLKH